MEHTDGSPPPRGGGIITARVKNDYDWALSDTDSEVVKKNIEDTWGSEHMYASAKAAFELFGNCELAKVMLRNAAKSNPHIMTRILSRHPEPGEWQPLNMSPPTSSQVAFSRRSMLYTSGVRDRILYEDRPPESLFLINPG